MSNSSFSFSRLLNSLKSLPRLAWIIILLAFITGLLIRGGGNSESSVGMEVHDTSTKAETWTCSMHPQINLPEAGQCPICFMDLIPLVSDGTDEGSGELIMSDNALQVAEILTELVRRDTAVAEILLSGKVAYDETRIKKITAWVPGRLEHLYVDYTGIRVSEGDHLVDIYSPDLYSTQEELVQALKQTNNSSSYLVKETAKLTLDAAREKLSLLGLTQKQIKNIEKRGYPQDKLTIYSPISGVVIHKDAVEGAYVQTGTQIYTIADLSRVWVTLDAYESDLSLLRFGQNVEFETEAVPGKIFHGRVAFIDPILDNRTRTVKVRVNLENSDNQLKPGMFVRARLKTELDKDGRAVNDDLAGKWISPMHPEVIKDKPGQCDVCGMDLVPAEKLGIVHQSESSDLPLLVPASAVLKTGQRALVYIKLPGREKPTFVSREVVLGPRAGDYYVVLSGLKAGEEIVTNGNFKIDSAMQIAAKPSMMNPEGGVSSTGHEHHGSTGKAESPAIKKLESSKAYHKTVQNLFDGYFAAQNSLASDDLKQAKAALYAVNLVTGAITDDLLELPDESLKFWQNARQSLLDATEHASHWPDFESARKAFEQVSITMLNLERALGHGGGTYYEVFCPMAFDDKGASWIQTDKKVNNPYFGAKMLRCGVVKEDFMPSKMEHGSHE